MNGSEHGHAGEDAGSASLRWSDDDESSIAVRFGRIATARPEALAVVSPVAVRTYGELDRQANRIAQGVARATARGNGAVATVLDHETEQVAALLAACRLGRRYVPIDAGCPPSRGAFILDDVEADVVVTDERNRATARAMAGAERVVLDIGAVADEAGWEDPGVTIALDAPLWVMYTSGTTGEPKGVLQTQRNLLRYVRTYTEAFRLGPRTRLLTLMSLTANGGSHDALMTLLNGGTLQTWNARRDGIVGLPAWIREQCSTLLSASPTAFRQLVAALAPSTQLSGVRIVKLWAEPAYRRDFDAFCRHFADDAVLVNRLGSTEQGSALWCFLGKDSRFEGLHLPVGHPTADASVLLVGEEGEVPDGQVGEIVVRSRHLSPGYWKRERETAAAFSIDPEDPAQRRYRTGDLGYRRPDGCHVCVGRKDAQIKVRGYRVEPAEVEQVLLSHPAIREAVVTGFADAAHPAEPRLVAHFIVAPGAHVAPVELRRLAASRLPDYMVPAAYVRMERFPQSPNGKVLRRALPAPGNERPDLDVPYRAAGTDVEARLVAIWSEVLRQQGIGIDDPFLDLGGDSLQAMQIAARVAEDFALDLSPADILSGSTIAEMARAIAAPGGRNRSPTDA